MEETRIKMVTDASWKNEDIMSGIPRLLREGGVMTTFAGLPAMLSKQIPYTISKQVSFDMIAALFYYLSRVLNISKSETVIWLISLASAFCTSLVSCIGSQPGDMILTMTYNNKDNNKGIRSIVKSIYRRHGLKGFFLGLDARILHVISIVTSQLMLYDIIKVSMGLGMTGSR
jgi:solute carrier family 25 phosphate transporter 3